VDWSEKNQERSIEAKQALSEPGRPDLSIAQQCELLALGRSGYCYEPVPGNGEYLSLKRLLDERYMRTPFYGSRRMTAWLPIQGCSVELKRVRRLLRMMGVEAIYPKPRTSVRGMPEQRYPYLL
jgi:putative transposase